MMHEQAGQPATPVNKRLAKNRIIFAGVLLILTFLAGFLPGYAKGRRLERELAEVSRRTDWPSFEIWLA